MRTFLQMAAEARKTKTPRVSSIMRASYDAQDKELWGYKGLSCSLLALYSCRFLAPRHVLHRFALILSC